MLPDIVAQTEESANADEPSASLSRMKLLRLAVSDDTNPRIPEDQRIPVVAAKLFSEETGEPVDQVLRVFWPTPDYPSLVERWMEREKPDMVYLWVNSYCFTYESVPLRIERRLGRFGRLVNRGSQRAANTRWLAETRPFRAGRRLAHRFIGGDLNFTPTEVLERVELLLRRVLEHEGAIVVVRGPRTAYGEDGGAKGLARAESRRKQVDDGLASICRRLHVEYHSKEGRTPAEADDQWLPDRIHANVASSYETGVEQGEQMVAAWRRAHSDSR